MPVLVNAANYENAIRSLLGQGEELLEFYGIGRKVIGVTSTRLLVSNFPFFGKPKALTDVRLAQIITFDYQVKGQNVIMQVADGTQSYSTKMPAMLVDVPGMFNKLTECIKKQNPNLSAAPYFEDGEEEVVSLPTTSGMFRVTNRNVYIVGEKMAPSGMPEELNKIALTDVSQFDFYEASMGSMRLFLQHPGGSELFKIGSLASMSHGLAGISGDGATGIHNDQWAPELAAQNLTHARPAYLNGEEPLFTVRAAKSKMGAISPKFQLRMTHKRVLLLAAEKDGALSVKEEYDRNDVGTPQLTKHLGQHRELLNLQAVFPNGLNVFVPSENETAFNGMLQALKQ